MQLGPLPPRGQISRGRGGQPLIDRRQDHVVEEGGPAGPPVLPGEQLVVAEPARLVWALDGLVAGQGQVRHGQLPPALCPAPVAERVELLEVPHRQAGLTAYQSPDPLLEGPVDFVVKVSGREPELLAVMDGQEPRGGLVDRDDYGT